MEPKAAAAEQLLRRLGVAVKSFALYPPAHPATAQAREGLWAGLRPYLEEHGAFTVRVTRHAILVDGTTFAQEPHASLALHLYTRKVLSFSVLSATTDHELSAFLAIIAMERGRLQAEGGVEHMLWQAGVGSVQVVELVLDQEEDLEGLGLSVFYALLGRGRMAPQERERVVEIVRASSESTARLLENVYAMTAEVLPGEDEEARTGHVFEALRTLDRIVLDEPFEEQPLLFQHLARAPLLLGEPLRARLRGVIIRGVADEEVTARALLDHFSADELAALIADFLEGEGAPTAVEGLLRSLAPDQQRLRTVVARLEERLSPGGSPPEWLRAAAAFQPPLPPTVRETELGAEFEFDDSQTWAGQEEVEHRAREAGEIDEPGVAREVVRTLVDVLRHETEEAEVKEIGDALMGHLPRIVEQQEYGLLAVVLKGLKDIAAAAGPSAPAAAALLAEVGRPGVLNPLLQALWTHRDTPVAGEVRACLGVVSDTVVGPVITTLGSEPRPGVRAVLCDLLIAIGRDRLEEIGRAAYDSRWYLVRNIVHVLGRLNRPEAVGHLERLVGHPEYRVRRETVDALAQIGSEEAQRVLARLLDDQDERVQLLAVHSLTASGVRAAMPQLVAILERRDPWSRHFALKRAVVEALERLADPQALPALRRVAGDRLALGQRGRELRDLARRAVTVIEGVEAVASGAEGSPA